MNDVDTQDRSLNSQTRETSGVWEHVMVVRDVHWHVSESDTGRKERFFVCLCVCVCVRACVRACVCVCVLRQSDRTVMIGRILLVVMENHCETKTLEASVGLV